MLAGAWGAGAGELLERAAERRGASVHRVGRLAMLTSPHLVEGSWCCWLFGKPEDRGALTARFGRGTRDDLPAAFGAALAELGEGACELLHGRFVVVALDRERDRCLVTRDQLGAHPVIHASVADGVLFTEHECDLLELLPRVPNPDRLALLQWIDNGSTPPRRTLYEGMRRLAPGHRLILSGTSASVERWWSLRYEGIEGGSVIALAERLRHAAFDAVGRAAADSKRPALSLSGGLDSACVAAALAANGFADGRAIALGAVFPDHPATDESELIELTARHTHLALERVAFSRHSSILAAAVEHMTRWRLPPATPNRFIWKPVMARARELGVDLMLDGEGGDELFGLAPYLIADMLRAGRLSAAWSLTRGIPGMGHSPSGRIRLRALRRFGVSPLVPAAIRRRRQAQAGAVVSGSIIPSGDAAALADLQTPNEDDRLDGPFWWRFLAESLIDEGDSLNVAGHFRRTVADEGIERNHPFLYDLQLVEAVLRLPPRTQFDPVRDRLLLREALTDLVPEAVRTRYAKSYFTPLLLSGLPADESALIEPLRRTDAPVRAYVAPGTLDLMIAAPVAERSMADARRLWQVAIADRWLVSQAGGSS